MKNKALKITLTVVVSIVLAVILLLALVKIGERILFTSFFVNSETEFKVPGIADGFVQQGFDYIEEEEIFLVSGYMKDGSSSRVYKLSKDGKSLGFTKLRSEQGGRNTTHAGGITHSGKYVYISNDTEDENDTVTNDVGVSVFLLDDILNKKEAKRQGVIDAGLNPAFCYVDSGLLYVGSFHKDGTKYLSPESHKVTTPSGDNNTAMIDVFKLDSANDKSFGLEDYAPEYAYSITSQVQGMAIAGNKLVLSTSYSIAKSHLYIYNFDKVRASGAGTTTAFGDEIALYYVDSSSLDKDVKAPPMAEELVYLDGKIFVMNESACAKYIFGRFTSGNYVHAYKIDK